MPDASVDDEPDSPHGLARLRGLLKALATAACSGCGPDSVLAEAMVAASADGGALLRHHPDGQLHPLAFAGIAPSTAVELARRDLPPIGAGRQEQPATATAATGPADAVTLPLRLADGGSVALLLTWNTAQALGPADRTMFDVLADLVGVGLDAASLRAQADRLAEIVQERRGTQDFLTALFADAPVGFALMDTDLRFVMVNQTLADINGVPAEEHSGRPVWEVLPELEPEAIGLLRQVLETGEPLRDVEVSGRTPASPEYKTWLEDFYQVRTPEGEVLGVAAILADVTAQRKSQRRLTQLIDSLNSFVGLCLPDGTLVEANRRALEAGGLTPSDVLGRKFWETAWWTWDPTVSAQLQAAVERARSGESSRYDVDVMMADGLMTIDFQLVPVLEDGEVVAIVPSASDITARRRSVEQATGLATLAKHLNASSTVAEVAETIRGNAAAAIGALHAALALKDAAAGMIHLQQSPSVPEQVASRYRNLPLDSPNHIARCIRTRRTIIVADPVSLDDVEGSVEELERLRVGRAEAGVSITAATPLFDANGEVIGALALGWSSLFDLDEEHVARMRTLAEMCAQAIERARLTDAHLVAAERSSALSALAQDLASAVTIDQVRRAVTHAAPPVVGALTTALGLVDADRAALAIYFSEHLPAELTRGLDRLPLTAGRPHTDAARTGRPVFLQSLAEHEAHYPGLLAKHCGRRIASSAVLPLRDNADRVIGTVSFTWAEPVRFDHMLRSTLDTVAELVGQTLERARLHSAEHELVAGLQRRLLRPMPVVAGLQAHAVYRASQTAVGIGGDFHDGLLLPGGRLAIVLGDIAGHGMEAAAYMAQLRTMLSTLLATGTPLDRLFAQADAALDQVAGISLATAVAAIIDPRRRALSYVHAGHPPLVLRTPDGASTPLPGARGGLLGLGIAETDPVTVPFEPGSVLVGYTDGLVEVRGTPLDVGILGVASATAQAAAEHPALDAEPIADAILDRCVGDRRLPDDVALLVVTYPG